MDEKDLSTLNPTADNPRILMQERSEKLDRSMDEMGPVDGIVMNTNPAINELVSGNQRTAKFQVSADAKIVITHRYDEPTSTGTVAYGYVEVEGERWPYREVNWDRAKHLKGTELANMHAGEWDNDLRAERYQELLAADPDALDVLFIDSEEVGRLQDGWVNHDEADEEEIEDAKPEKKPAAEPSDGKSRWTIDQLLDLRESYTEQTGRSDDGFLDWLEDRDAI